MSLFSHKVILRLSGESAALALIGAYNAARAIATDLQSTRFIEGAAMDGCGDLWLGLEADAILENYGEFPVKCITRTGGISIRKWRLTNALLARYWPMLTMDFRKTAR